MGVDGVVCISVVLCALVCWVCGWVGMLCELACNECVCMCPSSYCISIRTHPMCDWTTFPCHYVRTGGTYVVAWTTNEVVVGVVSVSVSVCTNIGWKLYCDTYRTSFVCVLLPLYCRYLHSCLDNE